MRKFNLFHLVILLGCTNSVEDLEIGEPFNHVVAIEDQWELTEVRHVDNLDINKRYTDLTSMFISSTSELTFTGTSFSYSHGSGPNFLENSGEWAYDDNDYPEMVILNSNTELRLKEPIRSFNDTMILVLERKCEEKTVSSYEYYFKRK